MAPKEGWLKCTVSDGMLPKEYAVECNSLSGDVFSFFTSQEYIDSQHSYVKVNIMDCEGDNCLVYIPSTPLEAGASRSVIVHSRDVKEK